MDAARPLGPGNRTCWILPISAPYRDGARELFFQAVFSFGTTRPLVRWAGSQRLSSGVRVGDGQLPMTHSQIGTLAILDSTFRYRRSPGTGCSCDRRRWVLLRVGNLSSLVDSTAPGRICLPALPPMSNMRGPAAVYRHHYCDQEIGSGNLSCDVVLKLPLEDQILITPDVRMFQNSTHAWNAIMVNCRCLTGRRAVPTGARRPQRNSRKGLQQRLRAEPAQRGTLP
jgi:hypothetical protein